MKRDELLRHLRGHGCELLREGAKHSWWHLISSPERIRSLLMRHFKAGDKDLGVESAFYFGKLDAF